MSISRFANHSAKLREGGYTNRFPFNRITRKTIRFSDTACVRRRRQNDTPQKEASGLASSNPVSHASWSRHTTSASALRPVSGWINRTCLCIGKGAPTIAMQPEWLTSTVTALALCLCESSSHSTRNFTREITRLWVRRRAQRSSTVSIGFFNVLITTANLVKKDYIRGLRGKYNVRPRKCPGQWYFFEKGSSALGVSGSRGDGSPQRF